MNSLSSLLGALLLASTASARVLQNASVVATNKYDFIVIGGGTAGSVVASRLSETQSNKVLLIEAGVSNDGIQDAVVPMLGIDMTPNTPWDWNYTVTPQSGLNGRTFSYPRGRLLGGSSSVNIMVYNKGGSDDFNRWANFTGDEGWSWNSLQPYMQKNEKMVAPADNHNTTGQFLPGAHGFHGTLLTSLPGYPMPIDDLVLNATTQVPGYPYNEDMNQGNELGIGWAYSSIGDSKRSSSATAYLSSAVRARSNLDILTETTVTKLLITGSKGSQPQFTGVELTQGPEAPIYNLTAKKEVILSAGSIGTAQILLLSGIGDSSELQALGIKPLVDLPDVGKNLSDHPLLPNQFYVNSNNTFERWNRNPDVLAAELSNYYQTSQGPFVDTLCNHIGWIRVPDNSSIWETGADPSSGPTSGHYELVFANGWAGPAQAFPDTGNFLTVVTNVVTPASRGSVTLNSSSIWDKPLIDPGYYTSPIDLLLMREAYKGARTFLAAPAFKDYIIGPYGTAGASTDDDIDAYIRNFTTTVWHPTSTASMSPASADYGVTSPNLLVKKVSGLRIVDASIMPFVPAAHPEAAIYYVAERAADLIKASWS
ncbi:hypothetical protein EW146_g5405 [Bondarzewia mesenterica]|uniref:Glucose-methanol-choline oxidoreductase N-terminal domain-containing protein n=1 Tax=Bondarzewia mesenterica TaxID=1095465 RepID=A0A4S4LRL5_9AGAM|nr:hypothetical protein EW146_g5405 [Bondarzewia mesenterica]